MDRRWLYAFYHPYIRDSDGDYLKKLGIATDISSRIKSLRSTSIPGEFIRYRAIQVEDARQSEKLLHEIFKKHRVTMDREFFEVSFEQIDAQFDLIKASGGCEEYEDEGAREAWDKALPKASEVVLFESDGPPSLWNMGCREGEILEYNGVTVEVADATQSMVEYKGQTLSLSAAANAISLASGNSPTTKCSGWECFRWNGKKLTQHREECMSRGKSYESLVDQEGD